MVVGYFWPVSLGENGTGHDEFLVQVFRSEELQLQLKCLGRENSYSKT